MLLTVRQLARQRSALSALEKFKFANISQVTVPQLKASPLEYTVEEVKVPSIGGYVAGKLWQGKEAAAGESDTPILCMHGWLDNAGSFDTLLPLIMKPRMTALAIDFPGHGHSSHVAPVHYDAHVECMLAMHSVVRHYGWDKFTILGHSLGAIVGFVFAGVFPEAVHRFIAMENVRPIPRDCRKELRYAISKIMEVESRARKTPPSYEYDELIKRFHDGRGGTISLEGCKILMQRGANPLANNRYQFAHDIKTAMPTGLWRFSPSQTEEIATSIKCPVCFIKGEPGGDYEARENYDRIVELMRISAERVEYHGVPGTHHFHLNDPYPVAPIITQFLNS